MGGVAEHLPPKLYRTLRHRAPVLPPQRKAARRVPLMPLLGLCTSRLDGRNAPPACRQPRYGSRAGRRACAPWPEPSAGVAGVVRTVSIAPERIAHIGRGRPAWLGFCLT